MSYEVDALVEKGIAVLSENDYLSKEENQSLFGRYMDIYAALKDIKDWRGHILWHRDNCSIPEEFNNGKRVDKSLDYLARDILQFPRIIFPNLSKGLPPKLSVNPRQSPLEEVILFR
jgi:hypothetical protein